jgi:hypothetical protein
MATCRSCHAPVRWVLTAAGRRMPVDAEPDPAGLVLVQDGQAMMMDAPASREDLQPGEQTYTSHYATCPQADQWRTRQPG